MLRKLSLLLIAAALLASCSPNPTPAAIPTLVVNATSGAPESPVPARRDGIIATAEIVPAQSVDLGFAAAGFVDAIYFAEGDTVREGDLLARQQNLEQLKITLEASQQSLQSAQHALDELVANAPLTLAEAQLRMVQDQKRYDDAVKKQKRSGFRRCNDETIDLYSERFEDAKDRLEKARDDNDGSLSALEALQSAQNQFDTAQANYLYCLNYTPQEIAESEAELAVAEAALKISTSRYEQLKSENGLDPVEYARLSAAVAEAQSRLASAQSAYDRAVLVAPFNGLVASVNATAGQAVNPGQTILTLASLDTWQVETTDLSERDIPRVKVGQTASVRLEAFAEDFPAEVVRIAPRATKAGGDAVYKVVLRFIETPPDLRWGMTGSVVLNVE